MNNLYKLLFGIFITTLVLHFYPEYWIHFLVAIPPAILVDFANLHSRTYDSLKRLQKFKESINKIKRGWALDKALKNENREKYRKNLLMNALEKATSIDRSEREMGLKQLSQFGTEDTYEKLLKILKTTKLKKSHEKQIVETLYNLKSANKW